MCIGDAVMAWAGEMMRDEETSEYVDGMAFHWYFGGSQRLLDGSVGWNSLERCEWMGGVPVLLHTDGHCSTEWINWRKKARNRPSDLRGRGYSASFR